LHCKGLADAVKDAPDRHVGKPKKALRVKGPRDARARQKLAAGGQNAALNRKKDGRGGGWRHAPKSQSLRPAARARDCLEQTRRSIRGGIRPDLGKTVRTGANGQGEKHLAALTTNPPKSSQTRSQRHPGGVTARRNSGSTKKKPNRESTSRR